MGEAEGVGSIAQHRREDAEPCGDGADRGHQRLLQRVLEDQRVGAGTERPPSSELAAGRRDGHDAPRAGLGQAGPQTAQGGGLPEVDGDDADLRRRGGVAVEHSDAAGFQRSDDALPERTGRYDLDA
jgi:hypothetical protein